MKTNAFGQQLRDDAPTLPSDNYRGEFYAKARNFMCQGDASANFKGKPKVYEMAYLEGFPHITLESYYGEGVVVDYHMTATVYTWDWAHRNDAWNWANERKQHIAMLR